MHTKQFQNRFENLIMNNQQEINRLVNHVNVLIYAFHSTIVCY